jgi:YbbR domain-containing protein
VVVLKGWQQLRVRLGTGILSRALFSMALAFLLWSWVTSLDDPEIDRPIESIVPTIIGQAENLVITDESRLPTITVSLRGPRSLLNDLSPTKLSVILDLGAIKAPGTVELPVSVTTPRGVRIMSISPSRITVGIDRVTARAFPLEIDKGPPIPPYSIGTVDTATKRVEVKGPSSALERIARVVLPVGLGDRRD